MCIGKKKEKKKKKKTHKLEQHEKEIKRKVKQNAYPLQGKKCRGIAWGGVHHKLCANKQVCKSHKKIWNKTDCQRSERRSKHTKGYKERLFWSYNTKRGAHYRENLFVGQINIQILHLQWQSARFIMIMYYLYVCLPHGEVSSAKIASFCEVWPKRTFFLTFCVFWSTRPITYLIHLYLCNKSNHFYQWQVRHLTVPLSYHRYLWQIPVTMRTNHWYGKEREFAPHTDTWKRLFILSSLKKAKYST